MAAQRGVSIASGDGVVFGLFHPAGPAPPTGTAVLLVPPFGWEDMCSYRSRRLWAQDLAAAGRPALRIDLPATGDSSGSPRDGGMLEPWTAAVADSAAWLRETTGATRIGAIGIGLGGLVAAHAAGTGAGIDELVLWAVNGRGKRLLRELRAFASLNSDVDPEDMPDRTDLALPPPQPDGSLAVGGFLLSAETVAELETLELDSDPFDGGLGRALLLGRDGIEPDARLGECLERAGIAVVTAPGDGYNAMMAHPQQAQPPLAAFEQVGAWLAEGETRETSGTGGTGESDEPAASAASGESESGFVTDHGGAQIRETPLALSLEFGDVYGVLSSCDSAADSGLTAVLLNAGALRRIGPGRLWVELSRDWAARGIQTLRLDLEGLGDADGDGGPYADTADLYSQHLVDQTLAVVDQLAERDIGSRYILGGLCSGAFWSFHAALEDSRVEAAFLLNPRALYFDARLDEVREARRARRVATTRAWKRAASGQIRPSRAAELLGAAAKAPFRARADNAAHVTRRGKIDVALEQLAATDKRLLFLFGEDEPLYDEMLADGQIERIERAPQMRLELIPGRDHSFRPISSQRHVKAVLDRAIEAELRGSGLSG
jgi:pimeloyl-ACP methyl ester carboxylesterase